MQFAHPILLNHQLTSLVMMFLKLLKICAVPMPLAVMIRPQKDVVVMIRPQKDVVVMIRPQMPVALADLYPYF